MQPQFLSPTQNQVPSTEIIIFGNNLKNRLKNSFSKRPSLNSLQDPLTPTQTISKTTSLPPIQKRIRSKSFSEGLPDSRLEKNATNPRHNSTAGDNQLFGTEIDLLSIKRKAQLNSEKIKKIKLHKLLPQIDQDKLQELYRPIPRTAQRSYSTQQPSNSPRYIGDFRRNQQNYWSRARPRPVPERPSEYNKILEKYMLFEIKELKKNRQRNSSNLFDYMDFSFPSMPTNFFNFNSTNQKQEIARDNFYQQERPFYYQNEANFHSKEDLAYQEYVNRSQAKKTFSDYIFSNQTRNVQHNNHQSPLRPTQNKKKYIMKNYNSEDFFRLDPVKTSTRQPSRQAEQRSSMNIDRRHQPRSSGSRHHLTPKYNSIQMVNNMPTDPLERQRENEHLERQLLLRYERRKKESAWFGRKLWNSIFD